MRSQEEIWPEVYVDVNPYLPVNPLAPSPNLFTRTNSRYMPLFVGGPSCDVLAPDL